MATPFVSFDAWLDGLSFSSDEARVETEEWLRKNELTTLESLLELEIDVDASHLPLGRRFVLRRAINKLRGTSNFLFLNGVPEGT
jgi:hypothetical protein